MIVGGLIGLLLFAALLWIVCNPDFEPYWGRVIAVGVVLVSGGALVGSLV